MKKEDEYGDRPETVISCAVKNSLNYIGVGVNHGAATTNLERDPHVYVPSAKIGVTKTTGVDTGRFMITSKGRILTLPDAWKLMDKFKAMDYTFYDYLSRSHEMDMTPEQLERAITSINFSGMLKEYGDIKLAEAYSGVHNQKIKNGIIKKYGLTIQEKYELTKGLGD